MPKFTPYPADVVNGWEDEPEGDDSYLDDYPPDFAWYDEEIDPNDYCSHCGHDLYDASDFGCPACDYRMAEAQHMSHEEASTYLAQFVMGSEDDDDPDDEDTWSGASEDDFHDLEDVDLRSEVGEGFEDEENEWDEFDQTFYDHTMRGVYKKGGTE